MSIEGWVKGWALWLGLSNGATQAKNDDSSEISKSTCDDAVLVHEPGLYQHDVATVKAIYFSYIWVIDLDRDIRARLNARRHQCVARVMHVEILNHMLLNSMTWPAMLADLSACGLRANVGVHGPPPGMGLGYLDVERFKALIETVFDRISPTQILVLKDLVYLSQKEREELQDNYPQLDFQSKSVGVFQVSRLVGHQCESDCFTVASPLG